MDLVSFLMIAFQGLERRWVPRFWTDFYSQHRRSCLQWLDPESILRDANMHALEECPYDWKVSHSHGYATRGKYCTFLFLIPFASELYCTVYCEVKKKSIIFNRCANHTIHSRCTLLLNFVFLSPNFTITINVVYPNVALIKFLLLELEFNFAYGLKIFLRHFCWFYSESYMALYRSCK